MMCDSSTEHLLEQLARFLFRLATTLVRFVPYCEKQRVWFLCVGLVLLKENGEEWPVHWPLLFDLVSLTYYDGVSAGLFLFILAYIHVS